MDFGSIFDAFLGRVFVDLFYPIFDAILLRFWKLFVDPQP